MSVGIGSTFARNITILKGWPQPFWGKYEELNKVTVPNISEIQAYQLQKIKKFEEESLNNMVKKHEKLNKLFTSGNVNQIGASYTKGENETINQAITNIVKALNSTYSARRKKKGEKEYEYYYETLQEKLSILKDAIEKVNKIFQLSPKGKEAQLINSKFITEIEAAMEACKIGSLGSLTLSQWFKQMNNFKGEIIEDIGTKWLNNLNIPNILTINTGAINYQGSLEKNRHKGQIIQDLMALNISNIDLNNTLIKYRTTTKKEQTVSLGQFFEIIQQASGDTEQIIIEDKAYDLLESLSAMNIQAKAGLNQTPWNFNSKNTQVSVEQLEKDNLVISAKRTIQLLHQLDCENIPEKSIWAKNTSRDYNLIADYGLATVLFKVLHLEGSQGNQYLLTPQGFTPYSTRIQTLMEAKKSRITFKGLIDISPNSGDVLGKLRAISMTNYN